MGADQSVIQQHSLFTTLQQAAPQESLLHSPIYGQATLRKGHDHSYVVQLSHLPAGQDDCSRLEQTIQFSCPAVLSLITYRMAHVNQMCGKAIQTQLVFPFLEETLEDDFQSRKAKGYFFQEEQLRTLLQDLTEGLVHLQKHGRKLSLSGSEVLIDRSGGTIKYRVLDPEYFPRGDTYHLLLMDKTKNIGPSLLSPEQIEQLALNQIDPDYDEWKSQMFTLGMVMMRMALLDDLSCVYSSNLFHPQQLQHKIKLVRNKYSLQLGNLLEMCLDLQPHKRKSLSDYHQLVKLNFGSLLPPDVSLPQPEKQSLLELSSLNDSKYQICQDKPMRFDPDQYVDSNIGDINSMLAKYKMDNITQGQLKQLVKGQAQMAPLSINPQNLLNTESLGNNNSINKIRKTEDIGVRDSQPIIMAADSMVRPMNDSLSGPMKDSMGPSKNRDTLGGEPVNNGSPLDQLVMMSETKQQNNESQSNVVQQPGQQLTDEQERRFIGEQPFEYENKVFNEHNNVLQHQDPVAPEQQLTMKVKNEAVEKKDTSQDIESEDEMKPGKKVLKDSGSMQVRSESAQVEQKGQDHGLQAPQDQQPNIVP